MDKFMPPFQLDYGPPGTLVKRPRLWRLAIGLLIMAGVSVAVLWLWALPGWLAATPTMDSRLGLAALGVGGIAVALHAVACDLLHVQRVRFTADGLHVKWSQVPHLLGARVAIERQVAWRDVDHLEWQEGRLENDLKQHLVLYLKTPLNLSQNRLQLLVCDDQNVNHCEALMAHLPPGVVTPCWLAAAQLCRQKKQTAR
jgi:signal transduction histidine kinase